MGQRLVQPACLGLAQTPPNLPCLQDAQQGFAYASSLKSALTIYAPLGAYGAALHEEKEQVLTGCGLVRMEQLEQG